MCGREDGESDVGRAEVGLQRHSIFLFSRTEGGTHPSVRSCHSPRVMVAEWVAGAGQTSHNLLLRLLLLLHLPPVPRALFQDVYKYENRTCLLTLAIRTEATRRASRYPCLDAARRAPHRARTGRSATRRRSISGNLRDRAPSSADYTRDLFVWMRFLPL